MANGKYGSQSAARKTKKITTGTVVFYSVFGLFLVLCIGAMLIGRSALVDWLKDYQASQPDVKSQQIFDELFGQPDWEKLYEMSGETDTKYEGSAAYAAYMENLVAGQTLKYVRTSAGTGGNRKYLVKAGDTVVADFTLQNTLPDAQIPNWELLSVNVAYYKRTQDAYILTVPGHTVYVNGVALDETAVVKTTLTDAESCLPEGVHGYRDQTLYISGLLTAPQITICSEDGTELAVSYDSETGIYSEDIPAQSEIPEEAKLLMQNAIMASGKYMINVSGHGLKNYFYTSGQAYKKITSGELGWTQSYQKYEFTEITVEDYYAYTDELYSAHVSTTLNVTYRSIFTGEIMIKEFPMDFTFFAKQGSDGTWKVDTQKNGNAQERSVQVRLTFVNNEETLLDTMVDAGTQNVTLPQVEVPEGKEFLGWFKKDMDENGKTHYSLVFAPSESGSVTISTQLEPMTLYAQFQNATKDTNGGME